MIKKLLIAALVFTCGKLSAQTTGNVPNGGFENWQPIFGGPEDPTNWFSLNSFIALYNIQNPGSPKPISTTKSTIVAAGSFAAKIESIDMQGAYPFQLPGLARDTAGAIFCGTVDLASSTVKGFPVNKKYSHFDFEYMYQGTNGTDSMYVSIIMYKNINGVQTNIGTVDKRLPDAATYTSISLPINYSSAETPDTAMIFISATHPVFPQLGSILYVDEAKFSGDLSIGKNLGLDKFEVYPNPATTNVTIKAQGKDASYVTLTDVTGKVVREEKLQNGQTRMHTEDLPNAVYILNILDSQRGLLGTSKLVKN